MQKLVSRYKKIIHLLKHLPKFQLTSHDGEVVKIDTPNLYNVIIESKSVKEIAGDDQAIAFVQHFNTFNIYSNSIILLKANRYLNSEKIWLNYFNKYLSSLGMSKLSLNGNEHEKFYRINSIPERKNTNGCLISIIMTSYNSEKTISHAINSILNQSWKHIELLIVDDLSSDNTWEIINSLAIKDSRIKPFRNNNNVGTYISKNIGLSHAKGDYVTCHDSDDWAHPQRIEKQVLRMINDNAKASMILQLRVLETMEVTRFMRAKNSCIDGITHFSLVSMMFDFNFLKEKLGGWDCVRFSADKEIYERAQIALKNNVKKYHILGLICLDASQSLTNHSIYGLSKSTNPDSPRKLYRNAYKEWHKNLSPDNTFLPFPHSPRQFDAPEIATVKDEEIKKLSL